MLREGIREVQAISLTVPKWAKKLLPLELRNRLAHQLLLASRSLGKCLFLQSGQESRKIYLSWSGETQMLLQVWSRLREMALRQIQLPWIRELCPINFGPLPLFFDQEIIVSSINFPVSLCFLALPSEQDPISNVDCSCNSPVSVGRSHLWEVHR